MPLPCSARLNIARLKEEQARAAYTDLMKQAGEALHLLKAAEAEREAAWTAYEAALPRYGVVAEVIPLQLEAAA